MGEYILTGDTMSALWMGAAYAGTVFTYSMAQQLMPKPSSIQEGILMQTLDASIAVGVGALVYSRGDTGSALLFGGAVAGGLLAMEAYTYLLSSVMSQA